MPAHYSPPRTSAGSEDDGGILPTGSQGSHFQQVATSWHQVPELKAGCVGVGLELRPFWRAQGTQVGEAEGMAELVWPWGSPAQEEASRPPLAADVHFQRWSWGKGVHSESPDTLSPLKKEERQRKKKGPEQRQGLAWRNQPCTPAPSYLPDLLPPTEDTYLHSLRLGSLPECDTHVPIGRREEGGGDGQRALGSVEASRGQGRDQREGCPLVWHSPRQGQKGITHKHTPSSGGSPAQAEAVCSFCPLSQRLGKNSLCSA